MKVVTHDAKPESRTGFIFTSPLKAATGAGFKKGILQNIEPQGFRYQNLENTAVSSGSEGDFGLSHGDAERHHAKNETTNARSDVTQSRIKAVDFA